MNVRKFLLIAEIALQQQAAKIITCDDILVSCIAFQNRIYVCGNGEDNFLRKAPRWQ